MQILGSRYNHNKSDGTCRYGTLCTFAHGEVEVRSKADNLMEIQPNMMGINPSMMNDPNFLMQMNMMMYQGILI